MFQEHDPDLCERVRSENGATNTERVVRPFGGTQEVRSRKRVSKWWPGTESNLSRFGGVRPFFGWERTDEIPSLFLARDLNRVVAGKEWCQDGIELEPLSRREAVLWPEADRRNPAGQGRLARLRLRPLSCEGKAHGHG